MRLLLAAGGTAGHINPALAIADKVKAVFPDSAVLFAGTPEGLEAKLVKLAGYDFAPLKAYNLRRRITPKNMLHNAKSAYYYISGIDAAKKIIDGFKPDAAIGTGGYVSAPVIRAAAKLGIKTAAHESNSLPGVTTKMLARHVDKIFIASADTIRHFKNPNDKMKCVVTGNPLRGMINPESQEEARKKLGLPDGITILSFGGSLGANGISEAVAALLAWESGKGSINHIHAYGGNGREVFSDMLRKNNVDADNPRFILNEYINNMYTCMAAADLVIARSGAMTQTELKAFGKASVQIPWSGAAENHQYYNALTMKEAGAAVIIEDRELNAQRLIETVGALCANGNRLRVMGENAAKLAVKNAAGIILSELLDLLNR